MLTLAALSALAACPRPRTAGDAGLPDAGDGVPAPCHVSPTARTCTTPPASLASDALQPGFLADVHNAVGLTGHLGRRVTFGDVDGNHYPDFISIETGVTPGLQHLFMNRPNPDGGPREFVETTGESGILHSRSEDGGVQVALMVAFADVDNDGDLDLFQGSYSQQPTGAKFVPQPNELYLNDGAGHFSLERDSGLNLPWPLTPSAAAFLDYDKDGKLDLVIEASAYENSHAWVYHQLPDHGFENVTELSGEAANLVNSNGLTVDDFDRDGHLDILMGSVNANGFNAPGGVEQLHLFRNQVANGNHWLHLTLHGVTANRQAIGAKVRVTSGCLTQLREISGGKGTFGAADPAYAHFGLGKETVVDTIEIEWPTQPPETQTLHDVAVDQFLEVTEGSDPLRCEPPSR